MQNERLFNVNVVVQKYLMANEIVHKKKIDYYVIENGHKVVKSQNVIEFHVCAVCMSVAPHR